MRKPFLLVGFFLLGVTGIKFDQPISIAPDQATCICRNGYKKVESIKGAVKSCVCEGMQCPANSADLNAPPDQCACKSGYYGTIEPIVDGYSSTSTCTKRDCPSNAQSTGESSCQCDAGYAGRISWDASSQDYTGTCTAIPCPANSVDLNANPDQCACKSGYYGTIEPIVNGYSSTSTCTKRDCPSNAQSTGESSCQCDAGYAGRISWDASSQDYTSTCTLIPCPANSAGTPPDLCECGTAYKGNITKAIGGYTGGCTPKSKIIEVGMVKNQNLGLLESRTVSFSSSFDEVPIVVATPVRPGGQPATIKIHDITANDFKMLIVEPHDMDGYHLDQEVSFMAALPGSHTMPDGKKIAAGAVRTKKVQEGLRHLRADAAQRDWETVTLPSSGSGSWFSSAPAFLTQVQTKANGEQFFMTVAAKDVTESTAKVAIEVAETQKGADVDEEEEIGWIAMEQGTGTIGNFKYSADLTETAIAKGWSDGTKQVTLTDTLMQPRAVVACQSSRLGGDGGWLRIFQKQQGSIGVKIDEDTVGDSERHHIEEMVSVVAWDTETASILEQ